MKITIIGCGYVGGAIARLWERSGHGVTVTTTTPEKVPELERLAQVAVLTGDNFEALREVVEDRDVVLLCVAPSKRIPGIYRATYLDTAKTLVKALKNSSVQQLIYTGSYSVLGDKDGEWTDEETPLTPANESGEILQETEQVLLSAQNGAVRVCILRLGGIYGPGREVVNIFRPLAGTNRPGNGEDYTNWVHLDDIVQAIEFVRQKQLRGIYNLVKDVPLQSRELLERLSEIYGLAPVTWDESASSVRPYNARLSNQKIKAAGFNFKHSETLPKATG